MNSMIINTEIFQFEHILTAEIPHEIKVRAMSFCYSMLEGRNSGQLKKKDCVPQYHIILGEHTFTRKWDSQLDTPETFKSYVDHIAKCIEAEYLYFFGEFSEQQKSLMFELFDLKNRFGIRGIAHKRNGKFENFEWEFSNEYHAYIENRHNTI